jgi:hypothetical protein
MIEFVTASHNNIVLKDNLLRSKVVKKYPLAVMTGFTNIPLVYNSAITHENIVCYVHHDVYLPETFEEQLLISLAQLPDDWEVLGVAGVIGNPKRNFGYINDRGKLWGEKILNPVKVETLDELLLITRGDIKFDEQFEQDFYGADICMNRNCYVIPCFVHHNSSRGFGQRTESFFRSQELFKKKWKEKLPVTTTCAYVN